MDVRQPRRRRPRRSRCCDAAAATTQPDGGDAACSDDAADAATQPDSLASQPGADWAGGLGRRARELSGTQRPGSRPGRLHPADGDRRFRGGADRRLERQLPRADRQPGRQRRRDPVEHRQLDGQRGQLRVDATVRRSVERRLKSCGCGGIDIQAAAQKAETAQGALALSGAIQQFGGGEPSRCGCGVGSGRRGRQHGLAGARLEPGDRREPDADQLRRFDGERGQPSAGTRQDTTQQSGSGSWPAGPGARPGSRHLAGCAAGSLAAQLGASNDASPVRVCEPGRWWFGRPVERRLVGGQRRQRRLDDADRDRRRSAAAACGCLHLADPGDRPAGRARPARSRRLGRIPALPEERRCRRFASAADGDGGSVGQENTGWFPQANGGNRGRTDQSASQLT